MKKHVLLTGLACSLFTVENSFAVVVDSGNWEGLSELVFDQVIGSSTTEVTITSSQTTATNVDNAFLKSVSLSNGTIINQFNTLTGVISAENFTTAGSGETIEIFNSTIAFDYTDAGFLSQLSSLHSNADLANYIRVDNTSFNPQYDVQFSTTLGLNNGLNYIIAEERLGNTDFDLIALDLSGNVIAGAETVQFVNGSYQWDTGIRNALDGAGGGVTQTQELSVISMDLFDTSEDIGGFRVVNYGDADIKFFVGVAVPEPSSAILLGLSSFSFLLRRRRR